MAPVSQVTCRQETEARRARGQGPHTCRSRGAGGGGGGTVSGKAGEMPASHPLSTPHTTFCRLSPCPRPPSGKPQGPFSKGVSSQGPPSVKLKHPLGGTQYFQVAPRNLSSARSPMSHLQVFSSPLNGQGDPSPMFTFHCSAVSTWKS